MNSSNKICIIHYGNVECVKTEILKDQNDDVLLDGSNMLHHTSELLRPHQRVAFPYLLLISILNISLLEFVWEKQPVE